MHSLVDGLNSGVAGYRVFIFCRVESISAKALTLRNLIDFKIVHVVHPLVHLAVECKLMRGNLLSHEALGMVLYNLHL